MAIENQSVTSFIKRFNTYLENSVGATEGTRYIYCRHSKHFLLTVFKNQKVEITQITPQEIIRYIIKRSKCYKPKTAKSVISSLRAFFRFLIMQGLIDHKRIDIIHTVQCRKTSSFPKILSKEQVQGLLDVFDVYKSNGCRGKAMALLMLFLGLRASEVASLTLDDIDWDEGILTIQDSKNRKSTMLPLPQNIGQALAEYLIKERPNTKYRQIFVKHFPWKNIGTPIKAHVVQRIIRYAFNKMDKNIPEPISKGTHILRHTAASRMLHNGATIKEISDVLQLHALIQRSYIHKLIFQYWQMSLCLGRRCDNENSQIYGKKGK